MSASTKVAIGGFSLKDFITVPVAPRIRAMYNTGTLMDIPTGSYQPTRRGNYLLNGGLGYVFSVVGPGNSFKTDQALFPVFLVLAKIKYARVIIYDTENSLNYERIIRIALRCGMTEEQLCLDSDDPLVTLVQSADILGDEYYQSIRGMRDFKIKNRKKLEMLLPWRDADGNLFVVAKPHFLPFDSLSAFKISSVEEGIIEKNNVGDSGANMQFMREGAAKTQLIMDMLNTTVKADLYIQMTAHMGKFIEISAYAPKPPRLAYQAAGKVMKGVPEKFSFINNFILDVWNSSPLLGDDKGPKYPDTESDRQKGNDLMQVVSVSTRNKSGASGITFPYLFSQGEGMLFELQMLDYIKEVGKKMGDLGVGFGLMGNLQRYSLVFYPDTVMQRTTVRTIVKSDPDLLQALTLTTHLLQIRNHWKGFEEWWLTPEEIVEKITAQGYDLTKLFHTRFYWIPEDEECRVGELPELSAYDLCAIAHGKYHPYFLDKDKKSYVKDCFDEDGRLTVKGFKAGL